MMTNFLCLPVEQYCFYTPGVGCQVSVRLNLSALKTGIANPMAASAATTTIHVLRNRSIVTTVVIILAAEIIGMTASTGWRVL